MTTSSLDDVDTGQEYEEKACGTERKKNLNLP
jgi:hypothetical protein